MHIPAHDLLSITSLAGRWQINQAALTSPLLGATIRFEVQATDHLTIRTTNHANHLAPSQMWTCQIDDRDWVRWPASQGEQTFQLTPATHQVTIMTGGNCDLDDVWFNHEEFALNGFDVAERAVIKPVSQAKKVLVIGDSITAGCWVAGKHASADYRPEANYVGVAQGLLPMVQLDRLAYSAAGVLRPGTGNVPPARQWLSHRDHAHLATPGTYELVVIALGVNDRRFPMNDFEATYREFVQAVQERYQCPVALMVPFLQSFKDSIETIGQGLNLPVISTSHWCQHTTDGLHPDLIGSKEAGEHFAQAIQQLVQ